MATVCGLLRSGWTGVWPFKVRPRGGARPWWLRTLLPGPAGQGLSVGLREGAVPLPAQVPPVWSHGPGHSKPLAPGRRPLHACGAHGESGSAVVLPTQLAASWAWGSVCCPRAASPEAWGCAEGDFKSQAVGGRGWGGILRQSGTRTKARSGAVTACGGPTPLWAQTGAKASGAPAATARTLPPPPPPPPYLRPVDRNLGPGSPSASTWRVDCSAKGT